MALMELLARGGPVMYVLLGLSVAATAIVLLKTLELIELRLRDGDFAEQTLELVEARRGAAALGVLEDRRHPLALLLATAVRVGTDAGVDAQVARAEVQRCGTNLLRRQERGLRLLASIAHLSPLLGLLGTVLGMIEAFRTVEQAGAVVDPAVLSGGIWQALLTTAFGLTIAIGAMAAFYAFEGVVDRLAARMKDYAGRVLVACGKVGLEDTALTVDDLERSAHGI